MPEHKIEIIINNPDAAKDSKKTAAFPRRRPHQLGRRRLQDGIRLFDGGWQWNGSSWGLLPYRDPAADTPLGHNGTIFTNFGRHAESSDFEQRDGLIFDVPTNEWQTTFKQIDETLIDTSSFSVTVFWNGDSEVLTD